jgi:hypothetical protein
MLTPEMFDKALKSAGVGKTGSISLTQFTSALDILQNEVEEQFAEEDDEVTDQLEEDEERDEDKTSSAAEAKPKGVTRGNAGALEASSLIPSAADVAMSLANGDVIKDDRYDYSRMLDTLEGLHNKQQGNGKKKANTKTPQNAPAAPAPTPAAIPVSVNAGPTVTPTAKTVAASVDETEADNEEFDDADERGSDDENEEEEEEFPEEDTRTHEEKAQKIYDELRGKRPHATVADFLQWDDVVELLDCGAVTKEQLGLALGEAKITVDHPDKTELPFEKVRRH